MKQIELMNGWQFAGQADSLENARKNPLQSVELPHSWNAKDGANGQVYLRAKCWYFKELEVPLLGEDEEFWLEFLGAAIIAEVYLNGQRLTTHNGGFTAFRVNLTPALAEKNLLAVSVDNRKNNAVYPQDADFTFYGGIYREVRGLVAPRIRFALDRFGAPALKVTPTVTGTSAHVTVEAFTEGDPAAVFVTVDGQTVRAAVVDNYACAEFEIANVHLWNGIADPYLYTAEAVLENGEKTSTRFGCRTLRFDPNEGFFLNGAAYPLRGVARHQDRDAVGNVLTHQMMEEDMEILCELGANTVRLAHYPHHPYFYDLCDQRGIVVWAEIPYISRHMKEGNANLMEQLQELVLQQYNHPSIVCWGLSNEISMLSEMDESLLETHRALNALCHRLDATRPTTMAHVNSLEKDAPLHRCADLGSYNLYFGWYLGEFHENETFLDTFHAMNPDRCIGLSEYGADANPQFQSEKPQRGDYSETYQALYHEKLAAIIEARPYLWATHVWNLFDFGVAARNEGGNPGKNQKGLVTMDRKIKKDAFYLYKAYWNPEPMVHLCGSRYVERAVEETEVKVYSNQDCVALYVNGSLLETQTGYRVFTFRVPMQAEMELTAKAGTCTDTIRIRKVDAPNKAYAMSGSKKVVNWFDQEAFKDTFCSIKDTLGSLLENPATAEETLAFCERMVPGFREDKPLIRMLSGLPLEGLVNRNLATVDKDDVRSFNRFLQRTPKL